MANGSTGRRKPAAVPPRYTPARQGRRTASAAITSAGMTAHTLIAPAKPNAAPPQASLFQSSVTWSPSNTTTAPARQHSTSQGSCSTVIDAAMASG